VTHVRPFVEDGEVLCSTCHEMMEPVEYRRFPGRHRHLFWRCPRGHVSSTLPIPDSLVVSAGTGTVGDVMHRGSDRVQQPGVATPAARDVPDR
jgi:hypothetical protein